jgi:hypothetical protein
MWFRASSGIIFRSVQHKIVFGLLLFGLVTALPAAGQMSTSDIEVIQNAIVGSNAGWEAGENSITRMSAEDRRAMLGHIPDPVGTPERPRATTSALALPSEFSWGDHNNRNWMTPIRDQGGCGSCWAFGTAAAFEARERIRVNNPGLYIDLAEQTMVSCFKGDCGGATATWIMQMIQTNGVQDEACFPYVSGSEYVPPCTDRCDDWANRTYWITDYGYRVGPSVTTIKNEIMNFGPVQIHMEVYEDFYAYNGGVYQYTSGADDGGHLICFYGWDDAENCWLAKNSWGTDWGEVGPDGTRGWFRIRMGTNEVEVESYVYFLDPLGIGYPSLVSCTPDRNDCAAATSADIVGTFDRYMDPLTITDATVFVNSSLTGNHPATITFNDPSSTLTIDPGTDFVAGEEVSIVLSPEITSYEGMWLGTGLSWSYRTATSGGTGAFGGEISCATGAGPLSMAVGDFNGDGYGDMVSANTVGGFISVFLADGAGGFAAGVPYGTGAGPRGLAAADLDKDGDLDLMTANQLSHTYSILRNNGNGTFAAATNYYTIASPRYLTVGDLDADGDCDMVIGSFDSDAIRAYFNDGTGSLTNPVQRACGGGLYSLAMGDLDNDGDFDVLYPAYAGNMLGVLWNDGFGTFSGLSFYPAGLGPRGVATADFDGDGLLDAVTIDYSAQTASVMLNDGSFGFVTTSLPTAPLGGEGISAADLNSDGFIDIAVYGSTGLVALMNNGDGSFAAISEVTTGEFFGGAAADFDGDDDLDLAAVSFGSQKIAVLFNSACIDSDNDGFGDPGNPVQLCGPVDNCPTVENPDQTDTNSDGIGDACCCVNQVGDANGDGGVEPTIGDISAMIDSKFISGNHLLIACFAEGDVNRSAVSVATWDDVTIGDISMVIDYLFITGPNNMDLPDCP